MIMRLTFVPLFSE